MAITQRYLILTGLILLGFLDANAQPAPIPVKFRVLSISNLNGIEPILCDISANKPVVIRPTHNQFTDELSCPPNSEVVFYRERPSPTPNGSPVRVSVGSARLADGGPYLVTLFTVRDSTGTDNNQVKVLDNSWSAHPINSARVINFSRRHSAVKLALSAQELAFTEAHIFPYPGNKGYVLLKIATRENGEWNLRWDTAQGIVPSARPTFIINDTPPSEDDPNPLTIEIITIWDPSRPTKG